MKILDVDTKSIESLAQELDKVDRGSYYLRVKYDRSGKLCYDTVAKEKGFFGRITQFFTRLFDSSYNINQGSACLFSALKEAQFSSSAPPDLAFGVTSAANTLLRVVTHVNEKRFFGKADLPKWVYQAVKDGLTAWVKENPEEIGRVGAMERILNCLSQQTTELNLAGLNLSSLPPQIGLLRHIEKLILEKNRLVCLPKEIGYLTRLEELVLNHNALTTLPTTIRCLTSLKTLRLTGNKLTSLPKEMGHLSSLEKLFLSRNNLTELPTEASGLQALTQIDLTENPHLTSIPESFCKLPSLKQIYISSDKYGLIPQTEVRATVIKC